MGWPLLFPILQNGYKRRLLERDGEYAGRPFHIEMFQTTVARVMEKYHYEHDFCL